MVPLAYNQVGIFKDDYRYAYSKLMLLNQNKLEFLYWYRIYKCPKQERTVFLQQFIEDLEGKHGDNIIPVEREEISAT